jgi:hypothetical protein
VLTGHEVDFAQVTAARAGRTRCRCGATWSGTSRPIGELGGGEYFEPIRAQATNAPAQLSAADPDDTWFRAGEKITIGEPRIPEPAPGSEVEAHWPVEEDVIGEQQPPTSTRFAPHDLGSDAEDPGADAEEARSRISAIQRGSMEGREAGMDMDQ